MTIGLPRRHFLLTVLAALTASGGFAFADDKPGHGRDQDRARKAWKEGRARPLADILDRLGDRLGGRIVGVELEGDDRRPVYEFKVVTPDGRLLEIDVDAMTAEILRTEEDD